MTSFPASSENTFIDTIEIFLVSGYQNFIEVYLGKIILSFSTIVFGIILSYVLYKFVIYIFKRFNVLGLINKLESKMTAGVNNEDSKKTQQKSEKKEIFTKKFKIDQIIAKAVAYYVFLLFFRFAITQYGIQDIENFMDELLHYLPKLFIGAMIGYFGFRFSKFVHDVTYYTFGVKAKDTAKIIAIGIRGIVVFFTIMAVLDQVGIATEVTTTILNGFIAMLAIAGGLAFGLGGKDVAREILESFKK